MKNACGTCRHWDQAASPLNLASRLGLCRYIAFLPTSREWNDSATDDEPDYVLKNEYLSRRAFVSDAENYTADLYTRSDFYCADYEN